MILFNVGAAISFTNIILASAVSFLIAMSRLESTNYFGYSSRITESLRTSIQL